eukprot:Lankesteria_metandrocarpae@DN5396_c0_g1_i2.p1
MIPTIDGSGIGNVMSTYTAEPVLPSKDEGVRKRGGPANSMQQQQFAFFPQGFASAHGRLKDSAGSGSCGARTTDFTIKVPPDAAGVCTGGTTTITRGAESDAALSTLCLNSTQPQGDAMRIQAAPTNKNASFSRKQHAAVCPPPPPSDRRSVNVCIGESVGGVLSLADGPKCFSNEFGMKWNSTESTERFADAAAAEEPLANKSEFPKTRGGTQTPAVPGSTKGTVRVHEIDSRIRWHDWINELTINLSSILTSTGTTPMIRHGLTDVLQDCAGDLGYAMFPFPGVNCHKLVGVGGPDFGAPPVLAHPDEFKNPSSYLKLYGDPFCCVANTELHSDSLTPMFSGDTGNWQCLNCGNMNFPRRYRCNKCRRNRDREGDRIVGSYVRKVHEIHRKAYNLQLLSVDTKVGGGGNAGSGRRQQHNNYSGNVSMNKNINSMNKNINTKNNNNFIHHHFTGGSAMYAGRSSSSGGCAGTGVFAKNVSNQQQGDTERPAPQRYVNNSGSRSYTHMSNTAVRNENVCGGAGCSSSTSIPATSGSSANKKDLSNNANSGPTTSGQMIHKNYSLHNQKNHGVSTAGHENTAHVNLFATASAGDSKTMLPSGGCGSGRVISTTNEIVNNDRCNPHNATADAHTNNVGCASVNPNMTSSKDALHKGSTPLNRQPLQQEKNHTNVSNYSLQQQHMMPVAAGTHNNATARTHNTPGGTKNKAAMKVVIDDSSNSCCSRVDVDRSSMIKDSNDHSNQQQYIIRNRDSSAKDSSTDATNTSTTDNTATAINNITYDNNSICDKIVASAAVLPTNIAVQINNPRVSSEPSWSPQDATRSGSSHCSPSQTSISVRDRHIGVSLESNSHSSARVMATAADYVSNGTPLHSSILRNNYGTYNDSSGFGVTGAVAAAERGDVVQLPLQCAKVITSPLPLQSTQHVDIDGRHQQRSSDFTKPDFGIMTAMTYNNDHNNVATPIYSGATRKMMEDTNDFDNPHNQFVQPHRQYAPHRQCVPTCSSSNSSPMASYGGQQQKHNLQTTGTHLLYQLSGTNKSPTSAAQLSPSLQLQLHSACDDRGDEPVLLQHRPSQQQRVSVMNYNMQDSDNADHHLDHSSSATGVRNNDVAAVDDVELRRMLLLEYSRSGLDGRTNDTTLALNNTTMPVNKKLNNTASPPKCSATIHTDGTIFSDHMVCTGSRSGLHNALDSRSEKTGCLDVSAGTGSNGGSGRFVHAAFRANESAACTEDHDDGSTVGTDARNPLVYLVAHDDSVKWLIEALAAAAYCSAFV